MANNQYVSNLAVSYKGIGKIKNLEMMSMKERFLAGAIFVDWKLKNINQVTSLLGFEKIEQWLHWIKGKIPIFIDL